MGLPDARPFNDLGCLTCQNADIERKELFPGLSNQDDPPQRKTAAPTGIAGGGKELRNGGHLSVANFYHVPRIIATHYFGIEVCP